MATEERHAHRAGETPWQRLLAPAALTGIGTAVLAKAVGWGRYELLVASLLAAAALLAALALSRGPRADPYAGPLALKVGILALTIFLQPSLVGRDPHFALAVTERIVEQGAWEPGLGFASFKASGYAHYPGLSFVTGTFAILTGLEPGTLARLIPPMLSALALVLVIAIACQILDDHRRAAWVGLAWAAFWMANVFQSEYVHEALGYPLFLAGVLLMFAYNRSGSWSWILFFALIAGALVLTHHLTTAFLLAFLCLFALVALVLRTTGVQKGTQPRAWLPVGLFVGLALGYNFVFGDPNMFGYLESIQEMLIGTSEQAPSASPSSPSAPSSSPTATAAPDPNVQQAVYYDRIGRDAVIFWARFALLGVLWLLSLGNLAWRALDGSLDVRWASLLAWSGLVCATGLAVYVENVTVGLDPPRLLPWAFVFLIITAADVPGPRELSSRIPERIRRAVPSPSQQIAGVLAVLVLVAGFQLLSLPPYLLDEEREPAYYRGQVRQVYHPDEQAMAAWVNSELDDGTLVLGDHTVRELVGPLENESRHGEVSVMHSYVYTGERDPRDDAYVVWRDEMSRAYFGFGRDMQSVFFPVSEEQRRSITDSEGYAKLYANSQTGVFDHER